MGPLQRTQRCRHGTACFLCKTAPGTKICLRERFFACARKTRKTRAFRRTPLEAAILADAVLGTPFDIWSAGQPSPVSLTFVPADAVSYTSAQVNFQGIYDTVKRVARAAFPQAQQGNADLVDTLAQQKLGMPVPDALGLLTGEFASMQTSPSMDSAKQIYFLVIRKKPETLKLIRTVLSEQITS